MIDRNGGYAIVDLKGKTLSDTPTTILGTHSAIAKAIAGSKPILLTGLTTGGPCFVQIAADGTSYVISGVYGNDITVTSADAVTSAAAGGGGGLLTFTVYSANSSPAFFGTYLFEPGMTFGDFIASDYNTDDLFTMDGEGDEGVVMFDEINLQTKAYDMITPADDILSKIGVGLIITA